MSEALRDSDASAEQNKLGPDYFGYYTREVADLLSQTEDFMTLSSQTSDLAGRTCGLIRKKDITKHNCTGKEGNNSESGSLFCDAVGSGLSDFKKESLKALFRQSVVALTQEVDEMIDPVIAIRRIHSYLRYKMNKSSCPDATCEVDAGKHPQKKLKLSSFSSSIRHTSPVSCSHNGEGPGNENMDLATPGEAISNGVKKRCSYCRTSETSRWSSGSEVLKTLCHDCEIKLKEGNESFSIKDQKRKSILGSNIGGEKEDGEVNDDLQFLLDADSSEVKERMKIYSNELSETLGRMEQKLEELLDTVMSNCRLMSRAEKQQLRKLIQKLPPRNLDRVVEIIRLNKPSADHSSDAIFVDLENEDNVTLWRLYYYIETVENARKLSGVHVS